MARKAILLANLGSPDAPDAKAVRRYLHQFLMDKYVIQLPWLLRKMIVCLFVLPTRPKQSAKAYQSVWSEQGSPLIELSEKLLEALKPKVNAPIEMAMRYGKPSIEQGILKLVNDNQDLEELLYIPLYPHYADSTITTSVKEAERVIQKHRLTIRLNVLPPFYQEPDYINALVNSATPYLEQQYDHLIFSYHGLPESHITKLDTSEQHCLKNNNCCDASNHQAHATCYRHQVFQTTRHFIQQAQIPADKYSIAFQSKLGRAKWLEPSTEQTLIRLGEQGVKKVLVICPAFVTDCLETLEEIALQGEETFKNAGGESLTLIPCMNSHSDWVNVLADWCNR